MWIWLLRLGLVVGGLGSVYLIYEFAEALFWLGSKFVSLVRGVALKAWVYVQRLSYKYIFSELIKRQAFKGVMTFAATFSLTWFVGARRANQFWRFVHRARVRLRWMLRRLRRWWRAKPMWWKLAVLGGVPFLIITVFIGVGSGAGFLLYMPFIGLLIDWAVKKSSVIGSEKALRSVGRLFNPVLGLMGRSQSARRIAHSQRVRKARKALRRVDPRRAVRGRYMKAKRRRVLLERAERAAELAAMAASEEDEDSKA